MTFYRTVADRREIPAPQSEGLIARMLRLWLEHHQRMMDFGIRPH